MAGAKNWEFYICLGSGVESGVGDLVAGLADQQVVLGRARVGGEVVPRLPLHTRHAHPAVTKTLQHQVGESRDHWSN